MLAFTSTITPTSTRSKLLWPLRCPGFVVRRTGRTAPARPSQIVLAKEAPSRESETGTRDPASPSPAGDAPPAAAVSVLSGDRLVLLAVLVSVAVIGAASGLGSQLIEAAEQAVSGEVSWVGAAVFIAVYAVSTVLLFPASVLTLGAGALFGPLKGTALVSVASTLGAGLAFLTSRYLARPLVEAKLAEYPKLQALVNGISAQGTKVVLLLRLSPLFPFNLLNYALGLTGVGFWGYLGASWLGMLPGTFAYVFLGGAGRAAADAATSGGALQPVQLGLYVLGAGATLAVTKLVADVASKELQQQEGQGPQ